MELAGELLIAFVATGGAIWVGIHTTRRVIANQFRPVVRPEPSGQSGMIPFSRSLTVS